MTNDQISMTNGTNFRGAWSLVISAFGVSRSAFLLLLFLGCSNSGVEVDSRDPEMIAAMLQARERIDEFTTALKTSKPGQTFAFKGRFREGGADEYLWLAFTRLDGESIAGRIVNDPEQVSNVRTGDERTIPLAEIADWAIIENGQTTGAFTDAVARKHASQRESR